MTNRRYSRLARQPVLEDHHRGDHVGALQVGDVEALDPQRRVVQPERVLHLLPAPGERAVRSLARLSLCCVSACSALRCDGLHQRPLVAALRHPQRRPGRRAARRASCGERLGVGGQRRHQDLARHVASSRLAAVELRRNCSTRSPVVDVLDLVDHPAALAADPAAADVEDLDRGLQRVLGERRPRRRRCRRRAPPPASPSPGAARRGRRAAGPPARTPARAAASPSRCSSRRINGSVLPAMKSQKSSTIARCSSASTRPTHGAEHLPM